MKTENSQIFIVVIATIVLVAAIWIPLWINNENKSKAIYKENSEVYRLRFNPTDSCLWIYYRRDIDSMPKYVYKADAYLVK